MKGSAEERIGIVARVFRAAREEEGLAVPATPDRVYPRRVPGAALHFYTAVFHAVISAGVKARFGALRKGDVGARGRWLLRAAVRCGPGLMIEGLDRMRAAASHGPVVLVANHMSTFETFTLPGILDPVRPATFVLKRELMAYPFLGDVLRVLEPVVVGRTNARDDLRVVLEEGQALLERGVTVILFPQTTRTLALQESSFNTLGVKLAARAGVPVVPLALRTDFWGIGSRVKDFGPIRPDHTIRFCFGDAMAVTRQGSRAVHQEIVSFIRSHLEEWGIPCEA